VIHLFGDFELDSSLYELRRNGEAMEISPRVFDVLAYLIRYRDRLVSKDELIRQVWGVTAMSGSSVPTCIAAVRKTLGDDPASPQYIETHRGRGYRFIAPVTQAVSENDADPTATASENGAPTCDIHGAGFVGRENELAALYAGFERTLAGIPQLVLIGGEPGIGKTRTIEEFALSARDDGAVVLIGRCAESEGAPAFWPWVQIVRSHIEASESATALHALGSLASSLLLMIPELSERHPDLPRPPQLDADQARFRLFEAVTALLANAAAERPLVVLVDDLHRADTASLLLLQFATRELRDAQVLFIGTYRDNELHTDSGRARLLSDLTREEPVRCIQLHGLPIESVERFLAQSSATGTATPSLVTTLYDQTGGNPFFLTQIVHLLTAEGDLDRLEPNALQKIDLPGGVREAIARQLDGLPHATRRILEAAAVAGRDFETAALAAASASEPNAVLASLEPALGRQLIASIPGQVGRYRFSHMLLRDCVYDGLGAAERIQLHLRIGEALEDLHSGRLDARITELAYHFHEAIPADGPDRAIHYSIEAARWADSRLAYEDVPSHYRRALQLLDQKTPNDPLEYGNLLLTLGQAEIRAGERDRAQETFKEAVQIARENNAPDLLAHAALGLAPGFFAIEVGVFDPLLVPLLQEALELENHTERSLRPQLLARLSLALSWTDSRQRRIQLSRDSLHMARELNDPQTLATALLAHHGCHWGPGQLRTRESILNELESISSRIEDADTHLVFKLLQITYCIESGNTPELHRQLTIFRHVAMGQRRPSLVWYSELFDAMLALLRGSFDQARVLAEQFRITGQRAADQNAVHAYAAQRAIIEFEAGRTDQLISAVRALADGYPTVSGWRCTLAYLLSEVGKTDAAQDEIDVLAANHFTEYSHRATDGIALNLIAAACANLKNRTHSRLLYEILSPAKSTDTVIAYAVAYFGPVADRLGQLAAIAGEQEKAERHFDFAITRCKRIGSPPWLARVEYHYAQSLVLRGTSSGYQKAKLVASHSAEIAHRLRMTHLANQVQTLLTEIAKRN
jgi:DNA-binding winged helix-turn-helix (wHTH) protein/tetratricopeptide (TPR) repeat protein